MIHDDPMPDFGAALEQRLRAAALQQAGVVAGTAATANEAAEPVAPARPSAPRDLGYRPSFRERLADHQPTRRRALGAAVLVVACVVALVMAITVRTPPAISGPDILNAPRVTDPEYLRRLLGNSRTMGPDAGVDYARARVVEAAGGRAYLVPTRRGYWCLRVPLPNRDPALRGYGVGCSTDAEFRRVGIAVVVGNALVAAVVDGVQPPTLRGPDGRLRTLRPNRLGVVVVRNPRGSTYTQFARTGPPIEYAFDAVTGIPTGGGGSGAGGSAGAPSGGSAGGRSEPGVDPGGTSSTALVRCLPNRPWTRMCKRHNRNVLLQRQKAKRRARERAARPRSGS